MRSSELEQALLLLPFTDALRLMSYLVAWLKEGGQVGAPIDVWGWMGYLECRLASLSTRVSSLLYSLPRCSTRFLCRPSHHRWSCCAACPRCCCACTCSS